MHTIAYTVCYNAVVIHTRSPVLVTASGLVASQCSVVSFANAISCHHNVRTTKLTAVSYNRLTAAVTATVAAAACAEASRLLWLLPFTNAIRCSFKAIVSALC
jgi:hypothetical protein